MHPKRKQRLILISLMVAAISIAVGLMLFVLRENVNLFYAPTDIAEGKAQPGEFIRAGGMVVEGSVKRSTETLLVQFDLTDHKNEITVKYDGILPDLFREGQGIVTQGRLDASGVFHASEVLAKHDENYMPPEVAEALKTAAESGDEKPQAL